MRQRGLGVMAVAAMMAASGCRASVHQVRLERVDQDLTGGNRGYLVGTPPAVADRGTPTRGITELEVQLPSGATRARKQRVAPQSAVPTTEATAAADMRPARQGTIVFLPPEEETALEPESASDVVESSGAGAAASAPVAFDRYTVKRGDNLSKIAKRLYGDTNKWRRIYNANRDQLSNPNRVRPGMTLNIPTGGSPRRAPAQAPEAMQTASMESDLK